MDKADLREGDKTIWRKAWSLLPYSWPIRVALGVMFLFSAYPKITNLQAVVGDVQAYGILPAPLDVAFGYVLPFAELGLGITLVLGLLTRLAAAGGSLLMLSFIIAIGYNLARGNIIECGCFEVGGSSTIDWTLIARDVGFLIALALPLLDRAHWVSLDRWIGDQEG